ncbi:MAG: hypothetical protein RRA94_03010 [Bacteroidota bacterium]|nr:hypothetical protein [Bacteroidota bacterium]
MRTPLRICLTLTLVSGMLLPATAQADGPERSRHASWLQDGGDVLRPERAAPDNYVWYIGFDAGLTYARFQDGPISYYLPNPYHADNPLFGDPFPHAYPLLAAADEGDGLGLYLGVTLDFPLSSAFGLVLKGNYHNRTGSFVTETDIGEVHPDSETLLTTILQHETDWSFDYIGFDVLLRIQPLDIPLYALFGPSIGVLSSNTAELTQGILQPDDIYYTEWVNGREDIVNEFRSASSDGEVAGFTETRVDLKFGLGYWIPLTPSLSLVPEVGVAVPMTTFVDRVYPAEPGPGTVTDDAALIDWNNSRREPVVDFNRDFNMITSFITIGLRWHID